jgi:hypothetical protein
VGFEPDFAQPGQWYNWGPTATRTCSQMTGSIVDLRESRIGAIRQAASHLFIALDRLYVIRSEGIPGVDAGTRWRQAGELVLREASVEDQPPELPASISRGKVKVNQFSYVDMLPLPFESQGHIAVVLELSGGAARLVLSAEHAKLSLLGDAKYIAHVEGMGR